MNKKHEPWAGNKHVRTDRNEQTEELLRSKVLLELPDALNATIREPGYLITTKKILLVLEILQRRRVSVRDVMSDPKWIVEILELLTELGWSHGIARGTQIFVSAQPIVEFQEVTLGEGPEVSKLSELLFASENSGPDLRSHPDDRSAASPMFLINHYLVERWIRIIQQLSSEQAKSILPLLGNRPEGVTASMWMLLGLLNRLGWKQLYSTGNQLLGMNPIGQLKTLEVNFVDPDVNSAMDREAFKLSGHEYGI